MKTEKKIEDYLHLYLGCMFVLEIRGEKGNYSAPIYFGVDALLASTYHTKYGDKIYPILILRPLSDMSEEEKRMALDLNGEFRIENTVTWTYEGFRYLLSQQFDLFGLIESGLAIDKTLNI